MCDNEQLCPIIPLNDHELSYDNDGDDDGGDEVLDYVLCGSRVSQMTRTYNDIDAVTRLLEEKEKDLELAAKIGQQLLQRNRGLEDRNSILESDLTSSSDQITQLRHDLQMKTDLLQIYTNDVDDSSCDTTPSTFRHINVDLLHQRVRSLEDDNQELRQEASQIATDTQDCEDREKQLVTDVIKQLNDANIQVVQFNDELGKKAEDSLRQQEEITQLLAQVVDFQARCRRLGVDNEELGNMVGVARECQQELTTELADLKEKYAEVLDLLHDTQGQLRNVQKKSMPGSRGTHLGSGLYNPSYNKGSDSIATELNFLGSVGDEGSKPQNSRNMNRIFDTVRLGSRTNNTMTQAGLYNNNNLMYGGAASTHCTPTRQGSSILGAQTHMVDSRGYSSTGYTPGYPSYYGSQGSSVYTGSSGHPSLDSGADSDASMHTDSEDNYPASRAGVPGWPGTPDLDSCLRRLGPADRPGGPSFLPYGCRTPDSIMSTGSARSGMSSSGYGANDWRLPQKLQIVKPIEGSQTLHRWSSLATPHLGGLLEEREGVAIKGSAGVDLNLEVYSMSDLEEDEEIVEANPGKRFMFTSGVNTFVNSTVLHPDDLTTVTPSLGTTQLSHIPVTNESVSMNRGSGSVVNDGGYTSIPGTPAMIPSCPPSRRGSTATFSTNIGLAKVLNERGLKSEDGSIFTTATPANSPEATRPGSPVEYSYKLPGLDDLSKTFSYGASFLRRTFYGSGKLSQQSRRSSRSHHKTNLVERVQAMGVDRFVNQSSSVLSVGGVITTRPMAPSPLLHLSNLIISGAKTTTTSSDTTLTEMTPSMASTSINVGGIMSTPNILSPGARRPRPPVGAPMGIPGVPGSGQLNNRINILKPGQRADLGTVGAIGSRPRPTTLGTVPGRGRGDDQKMGTVGWTSFGRKGGLL